MQRILLKTTIGPVADDWNIDRFSLLTRHLASRRDPGGSPLYEVVAADRRENGDGDDSDLSGLAAGTFDQLWLFAVDVAGALTRRDCADILAFRRRGGGLFLTRDHQDMGASLLGLGPIGATHHFHSVNPDPDPAHSCRDDTGTPQIDWPNFHSGANGDLQEVSATAPLHPLMTSASGAPLRRLPAHPHEGEVGVPPVLARVARIVAEGRSVAGTRFNFCVAVDEPAPSGRVVSDSSFHHLVDYNWDPRLGAPSFVDEPAGAGVLAGADALADTHRYVENIAAWLGRRI